MSKTQIKTGGLADPISIPGATLSKYREPTSTVYISGSTLTLNLNVAQVFLHTLADNVTTLTISNVPSESNILVGFTLLVIGNGNTRTITWPASVKWAGGGAPTLSSGAFKTDVFSFISTDNGTTWLGFIGGQNF
jgi:hypothetical protein